jgi:hypothetical protein
MTTCLSCGAEFEPRAFYHRFCGICVRLEGFKRRGVEAHVTACIICGAVTVAPVVQGRPRCDECYAARRSR